MEHKPTEQLMEKLLETLPENHAQSVEGKSALDHIKRLITDALAKGHEVIVICEPSRPSLSRSAAVRLTCKLFHMRIALPVTKAWSHAYRVTADKIEPVADDGTVKTIYN